MLQIISNSNESTTGGELVINGNFSEISPTNLVQNGDFAEIGSELITNGDFSATSATKILDGNFPLPNENWALISSTINGGSATITGLGSLGGSANNWSISQEVIDIGVRSYKVTFTAKQLTGTGAMYGGIGYYNIFNQVITGEFVTYTFYQHNVVTTGNGTRVAFGGVDGGGSANTFEIKDVSVKELGEDWTTYTVGTSDISFTSEGAELSIDASDSLATIYTPTKILEDGKSYKVVVSMKGSAAFTASLAANKNDLQRIEFATPALTTDYQTFTYYFTQTDVGFDYNFAIKRKNGGGGASQTIFIQSASVQELGGDWTAETGWTFGDGKALANTSGTQQLYQNIGLVNGKSYKFSYAVSNFVSGAMYLSLNGNGFISPPSTSDNSNVVHYVTYSGSDGRIYFRGSPNINASITNISVQELDPNDYWTLSDLTLSIGDNKGIYTASNIGANFKNTSFVVVDGKSYRASFDIPDFTSGVLSWSTGSGSTSLSPTYDAADTGLTFDFVGDGSTGLKCEAGSIDSNTASITNLSVKLLGSYLDQSLYVTAADVQTIPQASVYYLVELTSMGSKNSLFFLPSSVVANNGRYTKLNFTVVSKDAIPDPANGIISFFDSVGGFDTFPMGFYEFKIYEQINPINLDPLLATGLLEKGFAFVRDFSGNMQELSDGYKEYNPTLTQYVYSK